ncbi:hypothetical protein F5144DRAFT_590551 [Chaetomium tenue]|uniref:Uncharacterized protein n=1 Tax=Chaetomium tenue TaxID=1854479 RepID=A0ACB7PJN5_9PEZI|nr:hypothetical protein F5144DRAFT_590551 [Chaetomium globosum]
MAGFLDGPPLPPDPPTQVGRLQIPSPGQPASGRRLKLLYPGISNTPAWIFSVCSGQWSVLVRDLEREIIPMARGFGMAITPGEVLGVGKFQIAEEVEEREKVGETLRPFGGGLALLKVKKFGLGYPSGNIGDDLNQGVVSVMSSNSDSSVGDCQIA